MTATTMILLRTLLAVLALTSTALAQTTLLAHWRLDETSGTVAVDSSGNGNDGVYTGTGFTLGVPGTCANSTAVDFDGADAYVKIGSSPGLDALVSDFTVASWVNIDVGLLMRIFSNERINGIGGSWALGPQVGGNLRFTTLGVQDYDQVSSVVVGNWHHIALVFDANFMAHFYLDGVLQGSVAGGAPGNAPTPVWFIGVLDLTGPFPEWFDGQIDDVQIYSGSATADEVLDLFQNPCDSLGSGIGTNFCQSAVNSTGGSALITTTGTASVAANDLVLVANPVPAGQPGIFYYGPDQLMGVPFGDGFRCVAGAAGTIERLFPFAVADGAGDLAFSVDNTAPAHAPQLGVVGSTWNFQAWFRDPAAAMSGFNLSDGLEIVFAP